MGWKLYYFVRRNLRTSGTENEYGVGWRGWLRAREVSGEGDVSLTRAPRDRV